MNLETTYLGMRLKNPIVPSASPLSYSVDGVRRMEDAGAAAVVLYSLFEEQIEREERTLAHYLDLGTESHAEATTYLPDPGQFQRAPEDYAEHVRRVKEAVDIPVVASLNGSTPGGWIHYARLLAAAGADAIELNLYEVGGRDGETGGDIEQRCLETVARVKERIPVPLAVKIGPFFSSLFEMAERFKAAGADGLVLFNRFYQPDIDLETLSLEPSIVLSGPAALRLPLTWCGLLRGRVDLSLAASGGVADHESALKVLLAGADVAMMASELLRNGVERIDDVLRGMKTWLEEREYESVEQMKGSMSQAACEDPHAYERANYMKMLLGYHLK